MSLRAVLGTQSCILARELSAELHLSCARVRSRFGLGLSFYMPVIQSRILTDLSRPLRIRPLACFTRAENPHAWLCLETHPVSSSRKTVPRNAVNNSGLQPFPRSLASSDHSGLVVLSHHDRMLRAYALCIGVHRLSRHFSLRIHVLQTLPPGLYPRPCNDSCPPCSTLQSDFTASAAISTTNDCSSSVDFLVRNDLRRIVLLIRLRCRSSSFWLGANAV